jgi:hypothetical protein
MVEGLLCNNSALIRSISDSRKVLAVGLGKIFSVMLARTMLRITRVTMESPVQYL